MIGALKNIGRSEEDRLEGVTLACFAYLFLALHSFWSCHLGMVSGTLKETG